GLLLDERGPIRFQTAPGVERCDGDPVLFPEAWDASAGRFRAVSLAPPDGEPLSPTPPPPPAAAPPLGLFRFVAASSQLGDDGRADRLAPPRELDDGRTESAWTEGMAGSGRGAWVTARARAPGQKIVGLRLVPGPGNRLRRLVLFAGAARYRLELGGARP